MEHAPKPNKLVGVPVAAEAPIDADKSWLTYLMNTTGFIAVHVALLAMIWVPVTWPALLLCGILYVVRMWAVTAGYHRYFAHRTYKTSRFFQFVLAFLAQTSAQKGVLWWAAHHREHHRTSDQPGDVHSPKQRGFWYSHLGWIWDPAHERTRLERIGDFARYPELVWLNRFHFLPPILLGVFSFLLLGWSGLIVGFFLSSVLVWHCTFTINSLSHVIGRRRYQTRDDSRNNWFLALITFGEGWHNNHHYYPRSTRQGFRWYEYDFTYYILKGLSWLGIVWDLREPPRDVVDGTRGPQTAAGTTEATTD